MLTDSSSSELSCNPVIRKRVKRQQVTTSESSDDYSPVKKPVRGVRSRISSSSSSSSSSYDQVRRKRIKRAIIDSDTSDSSDSYESESPILPFKKNSRRALLQSSDSCASEIESALGTTSTCPKSKNEGSSSDNDEGEHCIICFKTLQHPMARPSACSHIFHEKCLSTWSKMSNTCPIDRVKYNCINIVNADGKVLSTRLVTTPTPGPQSDVEPDALPTFCEVCHFHDREEVMLLCDRCDAGYHMDCLDPPLDSVPSGQWFCSSCEMTSIEDSEVLELLADNVLLESRLRTRPPRPTRNNHPRFNLSRRAVQAAINLANNATQATSIPTDEPSTSTGRRGSSVKRPWNRKKNSRRKHTTKYKVELVTTEDGTTVEVKLAIQSRRHKKKKKKSKFRKSGGGRCESDVGPSQGPHTGFHPAPLDLFGSRPTLDYFSGCEAEDEEDMGRELGAIRARHNIASSRSGLVSRKSIASVLSNTPPTPRPRLNIEAPVSSTNVLDSILRDQELWHHPGPASISSSSDGAVKVTLPNDGSGSTTREHAIHGGRHDGRGGGGRYRGRGSPSRGGRMSGGNRNSFGRGSGASTSNSSGGTSRSSVSNSGSYQPASSSSSSNFSPVIQPMPAPPMPPLIPPPEPPLKLCEDDDLDLYGDIEPPSVISKFQKGNRHQTGRKSTQDFR